ncbi:MAG: hypothetical protein ABTQ32_09135, partial [Myxococcaceae bacterium]
MFVAGLMLVLGQVSWIDQAHLSDSLAFQNERFGAAVAVEGDVAVVGAPGAWPNGVQGAGEVFVFTRVGAVWSLTQRLSGLGVGMNANFGTSVALAGDLLAVGAPGALTAFLYRRQNGVWVHVANLGDNGARYPPSRLANDDFGRAVAIIGPGAVIVGAPNHDQARGASYVFFEDTGTWRLVVRRSGSALIPGSSFGASISSRGGVAAIGGNGAAHLFAGAGTAITETARIVPAAGSPVSFGSAVSLFSANSLAVSAAFEPVGGNSSQGAVYVFDEVAPGGWRQQARLVDANGQAFDEFGRSIAASGDTLLVGVPGAGADGEVRVYLRTGSSWSLQAALLPGSAADGGTPSFGTSTALSTDTAVAGAPEQGFAKGNAVVFQRTRVTNGGACTLGGECQSGFCVDGVCCDTACGGGVVDCQACSPAAGAAVAGTCSGLTAQAAAATTCRAQSGACDLPETCQAGSTACPANAFAPSTTVCRAAAGPCDVAESCSGTSASCGGNAFAPSTTQCRASTGPCDVAEFCGGGSAGCPVDGFAPAVTICRAQAGSCDVPETCTGPSPA